MGPEEIIPFLVFVFYVVRTIMAQKKKAEKQRQNSERNRPSESYEQQPQAPKRRPPIIFESEEREVDILEELFGEKVEKPAPPKAKPQPIRVDPVNSLKDIELTEKRIADQMKLDYEEGLEKFREQIAKSFARKQVHNKRRRGSYAKHRITDFNLKKAVIFSEILRRPYE